MLASIEINAQVGSITGRVLDEKKEPLEGAIVEVMQGGIKKAGDVTCEDGSYTMKGLTTGKYDVEVKLAGYKTSRTTSIIVSPDRDNKIDIQLDSNTIDNDIVVVTEYKQPTTEDIQSIYEVERIICRGLQPTVQTSAGIYIREYKKQKRKEKRRKLYSWFSDLLSF